jgi:hypothetical protein
MSKTTTTTQQYQKPKHHQVIVKEPEVTFDNEEEGTTTTESRVYFNFINSLHSPSTLRNYKFVIKKFMQYHKVQNIDQLLTFAPPAPAPPPSATKETNTKVASLVDIENKVIDWLVYLRSSVVYGTRYMYMSALLTFYEVNDISLRKNRISRFLGAQSTRKHNDASRLVCCTQ